MNLTEASPSLKKPPRLHFLCGKIASGKSTLAKQLANAPVLFCSVKMNGLPPFILMKSLNWLTMLKKVP
ncbi:hypothetical protein ACLI07_20025 [Providencia huaxiensis]|uniref:hypothetical protein n=1 Tax=Providencia TaxID=586 RepID=UPI002349A98E|nr:hypothetical protein [Providencia sp. PROV076]